METGNIQSPQCPPCPSSMLALSPGGGCTLMLLTLPRLLPPQLFGVVEQTLFKVLPELVSVGALGQACTSPRAMPLPAPALINLGATQD